MRLGSAALVALTLTGVDQLIKGVVERSMALGEMIPVLPFFSLLRAHNEGVSFSFLAGTDHRLLIVLTGLITLGACWMLARTPPNDWPQRLGLALVIGGALGNLIDRIQHTYVIDYFLFHTPGWSFAIFNLADVGITCGAALVVIDEFIFKPKRASAPPPSG
ncbi:MAG: signal peptidase II [Rhizobiaceae bacterium]|jgi:signal peptidase II|nr:signal peptidase II [Rhizobiaceae bacterium]